jgi:hypothetical protein
MPRSAMSRFCSQSGMTFLIFMDIWVLFQVRYVANRYSTYVTHLGFEVSVNLNRSTAKPKVFTFTFFQFVLLVSSSYLRAS